MRFSHKSCTFQYFSGCWFVSHPDPSQHWLNILPKNVKLSFRNAWISDGRIVLSMCSGTVKRGWYDFILYLSGYIVSLLRKGFILLSEVRIWHQRPSIYSSHNLENPTSKFLPPTPSSPRVDLKKVWLCCCRCCLEQKFWFLPQDLRFPRIPLAMFDLVLSKSCLST